MSKTQIELSRQLLISGAQVLSSLARATDEGKQSSTAAEKDWTSVQSLLLSLRKCCNHPQLFGSWMGEVSAQAGEDLSTSSGKLATLGLLLDKLLPLGHRVVLFSGWTSMLDIIERFLQSKEILFCRLDGSTNRVQRQIDIKQFNQANSPLSVFLCSTRAGGLGITLTSADTVVIYDSDFNPQVDLQAMDRVHRIGQTKKVRVLRLVTHDSVEERIVQRARDKLFLMQRTMAAGAEAEDNPNAVDAPASKMSRSEAIKLLQFGVAGALSSQKAGGKTDVTLAQASAVLKEISTAMTRGDASITVGIGGRKPTAKASKEELAAAAASLGGEEAKEAEEAEPDASAEELHDVVDALGRTQRERTSRFIQVGEDLVLKINNYDIHEGEQSVFDSELKGRKGKGSKQERSRAGHDYENQPMCQICWGGGELICCDFCPGAYHPACLGIENVDDLPNTWSCPHHRCTLCDRRAGAAGGLLFRCTDCEKAYCEDHLPLESELLGGEVERLQELGFGAVKQACYCLCSAACKEIHEQREEAEQEDKEEEDEEEDGEEGEEDEDEGEEDDEAAGLRAAIEELESPPKVLAGMTAEVASQSEGELGSWYPVIVQSISGAKATVEHLHLTDQNDNPIIAKVKLAHLRPTPPEPPDGFTDALKSGAKAELAYLDGWWEVSVLKKTAAGKFQVLAEKYDAKHSVNGDKLRPAWSWTQESSHWEQRAK